MNNPSTEGGARVSIIIVTYNSRDEIGTCLDSIYQHTRGVAYEIIAVDNSSNDGTAAFIRQAYPDVIVIENPDNSGFGAANNIGISRSRAEFVFLLNPDTVLKSNAVRILHDCLADPAHADTAVCGAQLYSTDGSRAFSHDYFPSELQRRKRARAGQPERQVLSRNSGIEIIDGFVSGAAFFARRSALDEAGLFDEDFFLYYEETELCFRLMKKGLKIAVVPEAGIIHIGEASFQQTGRRHKGIFGRSERLFYKKCYGMFSAEYLYITYMRYARRVFRR